MIPCVTAGVDMSPFLRAGAAAQEAGAADHRGPPPDYAALSESGLQVSGLPLSLLRSLRLLDLYSCCSSLQQWLIVLSIFSLATEGGAYEQLSAEQIAESSEFFGCFAVDPDDDDLGWEEGRSKGEPSMRRKDLPQVYEDPCSAFLK